MSGGRRGSLVPGRAAPDDARLPGGWRRHWDDHTKDYYYFHEASGVSQWEFPEPGSDPHEDDGRSASSTRTLVGKALSGLRRELPTLIRADEALAQDGADMPSVAAAAAMDLLKDVRVWLPCLERISARLQAVIRQWALQADAHAEPGRSHGSGSGRQGGRAQPRDDSAEGRWGRTADRGRGTPRERDTMRQPIGASRGADGGRDAGRDGYRDRGLRPRDGGAERHWDSTSARDADAGHSRDMGRHRDKEWSRGGCSMDGNYDRENGHDRGKDRDRFRSRSRSLRRGSQLPLPPPPPRPDARLISKSPAREPSRRASQQARRPVSRSPSVKFSVNMPHNTAKVTGQALQAEVVERPANRDGESVWQAEITMPQGDVNHTGRPRVFTIRGPPRRTLEAAENDSRELTNVSVEGQKAVRTLANQLHRTAA